MSCSLVSVDPNGSYRGRHSSEDSTSSIGSDETLTEGSTTDRIQPKHPPPGLAPDGQGQPVSLQKTATIKSSSGAHAESALGSLSLSKAKAWLRGALSSSWQRVQHKRFTVCQAAYLFVINVTLLVLGLITLLTSNQPTDVDRKSLEAETESINMQKALLENSLQAIKTSNETLRSNKHSLSVEREVLELQRASFEKEKLELELQKQTLELAKWSAYHEYVAGCAAYAVRHPLNFLLETIDVRAPL